MLITSARKLLPRNALCSVLVIVSNLKCLFPGKCYSKTWLFLQNLTNGCLLAVKLTKVAHSNTLLGLSATWSWLSSLPFRATGACTSYEHRLCALPLWNHFFPPTLEEAQHQQSPKSNRDVGLCLALITWGFFNPFPLLLLNQMKMETSHMQERSIDNNRTLKRNQEKKTPELAL